MTSTCEKFETTRSPFLGPFPPRLLTQLPSISSSDWYLGLKTRRHRDSMANLTTLPPSVLNAITRLLDAVTVIKLAHLSGSAALWRQCVHRGGVCELVLGTSSPNQLCRGFLTHLTLGLPPFAHLTHFQLASARVLPVTPAWTIHLPPTLQEIDFAFDLALFAFVRPLTDSDPDELKYWWNINGTTPMEMSKYFPKLRKLKLKFLLAGFGQSFRNRFFSLIPTTLSSLRLDVTRVFQSDYPEHEIALRREVVQGLVELDLRPGLHPCPLALLAEIATNEPLPLERLCLHGIDSADPNLSLLQHLPSLASLELRFTAHNDPNPPPYFALPTTLTELHLSRIAQGPGLLSSHSIVRNLSNLTFLRISAVSPYDELVADDGTHYTTVAVTFLPPKLRHLALFGATYALKCDLPLSLTFLSISLHSSSTPPHLDVLSSLTTLEADIGAQPLRPSPQSPIPPLPAITELRMGHLQFLELQDLPLLPPSLRSLTSSLSLGSVALQALFKDKEEIREWRSNTLSERVRQLYTPQIPSEGFNVTIKSPFTKELIPKLAPNLEIIDDGVVINLRELSLPKLTHGAFRGGGSIIRVSDLSPVLESLQVLTRWVISSSDPMMPPSRSQMLTASEHRLPSTLTSLYLSDSAVFADLDTGELVGYPLLSTAPALTRLTIIAGPNYPLHTLPDTITDLSIQSKPAQGKELVLEWVTEAWLPKLKRFNCTGGYVPLRNFLPRLGQLERFRAPIFIYDQDECRLDLSGVGEELHILDLTNAVRQLLPWHLQHPQIEYAIEWGPNSLMQLPQSLKRCYGPYDPFFASVNNIATPTDLGRYLPPSLMHLSFPAIYFDAIHLPRSLTSVVLNWSTTQLFFDLPPQLVSLGLQSYPPDKITPQMVESLPRTLKVLTFVVGRSAKYNCVFESGALASLPPSLYMLSLCHTSFLPIEDLDRLPKSLGHLGLPSRFKIVYPHLEDHLKEVFPSTPIEWTQD